MCYTFKKDTSWKESDVICLSRLCDWFARCASGNSRKKLKLKDAILDSGLLAVYSPPFHRLLHCWLGHLTCKTVSEMAYNVLSGTLNPTIPIPFISLPLCEAIAMPVQPKSTVTAHWPVVICILLWGWRLSWPGFLSKHYTHEWSPIWLLSAFNIFDVYSIITKVATFSRLLRISKICKFEPLPRIPSFCHELLWIWFI